MKTDSRFSGWKATVSQLADEALLSETRSLMRSEREQTAWLVAHLAEVFRRELALKRGYPSFYEYARKELRLSDMMAYERVSAARLALQIPETVEKLAGGELTLSAACELWKAIREAEKKPRLPEPKGGLQPALGMGPTQTEVASPEPARDPAPLRSGEKRELFTKVLGKTRRESQAVLQDWKHDRSGNAAPPAPVRTTEVTFCLTDEELASFDRLRDLLSHKLGSRDAKAAFVWMLEQGLDRLDPVRKQERVDRRGANQAVAAKEASGDQCAAERLAGKEAPHKCCKETVRHNDAASNDTASDPTRLKRKPIPAAIKRRVWIRDQGKCQFAGPGSNQICGATAFLDLDHVLPVSEGGENSDANLRLACATHNRRRHRWS